MRKILFVEDDREYQMIINELLVREGYEVVLANSPYEALELFKNDKFNLVISDLIMEKIDGLQLVSLLKRIDAQTPIIILTGDHNDEKEIHGLDLNVDDYIYKPVSMEVLLKRIQKVIEKKAGRKGSIFSERDDIEVNFSQRKVYKNEIPVQLTKKEFELLGLLISNKNTIFTREELLEQIWHIDDELVDPRTIDTHVKNLRAKLDLTAINSIRGVGYEWFE